MIISSSSHVEIDPTLFATVIGVLLAGAVSFTAWLVKQVIRMMTLMEAMEYTQREHTRVIGRIIERLDEYDHANPSN